MGYAYILWIHDDGIRQGKMPSLKGKQYQEAVGKAVLTPA